MHDFMLIGGKTLIKEVTTVTTIIESGDILDLTKLEDFRAEEKYKEGV